MVGTLTHTHTYTHTHIHTHIYTHTYTHTYTCVRICVNIPYTSLHPQTHNQSCILMDYGEHKAESTFNAFKRVLYPFYYYSVTRFNMPKIMCFVAI